MPLFILNIFGWFVANWRLLAIVAGVVGVLIVFGLTMESCGKSSLDEKQIQKNQEAIASGERQRMVEALAESRLVEKQIDANRANAENLKLKTLDDARKEARAMSNEDLAKTLEGLK